MKFYISFSLLVCFILFPDDITGIFTKNDCFACCLSLKSKQTKCGQACHRRWARSQDFNSRNECKRSCTKGMLDCKQLCIDDCVARYEETPAGVRAPDRREKLRKEAREAREAAGYLGNRPRPTRTTKGSTPGTKKPSNNDEAGSSRRLWDYSWR